MNESSGSTAAGLAAGGAFLLLAAYAAIGGSKELVHRVAGREMLVENLGAAFFVAASLFFFLMARGEKASPRPRRLLLAGLGLFFLLAGGEEASWGQHWLGFETPDELKELNAQQETNLHNLWVIDSYAADAGKTKGFEKKKGLAALLLNSNRIFDLLMILFFWILPAAARWPNPLRGLISRWSAPVPAPPFAALLLANFFGTLAAELVLVDGAFRHLAVSEVREFGYAMLGLLAALELWRRPAPPAAGETALP
jgi:hypothetical protein